MTTRFRLWAAIVSVLPMFAMGCRCGHEHTASEREQAAPSITSKGAGAEEKAESGFETWEPSLYLIPESALDVIDEVEEIPPPRSAADELWVVVRRDYPAPAPAAARLGSTAQPLASGHDEPRPISIKATVTGFVASIDVRHSLVNSTPDTTDFVYELPLPHDASVRDFTVTLGARTIRGVIRGREEALSIYQLARQRGLVTSLIDLDHAASLRNTIDNVPPGQTLQLSFSYSTSLPYADSAFELRVPLSLKATITPKAETGSPGNAWPESPSGGTPVDMAVHLDMGMRLYGITSPTHQVSVEHSAPTRAGVRVTGPISTADKAFVLRCGVAGPGIAAGVFTHRDPTGDYLGICLVPPSQSASMPRRPLELLFLLDCSQSMRGMPIVTAKHMVEAGLAALDSLDTFAIATFGGRLLSEGLLPAHPAHVTQAAELVRSLPPNEGEGMADGLRAALTLPHGEGRLRILLMITDGHVDEPLGPVIELIRADPATRVFCLTAETAANKLLLEAIAVEGSGGIAYLRQEADAGDVVMGLLAGVSRPGLSDITLTIVGTTVEEMMPSRVPDLFAGRPVTLVARCGRFADARVILCGMGPEGPWKLERSLPPMQPSNPAIASVWARRRLGELIRQAMADSTSKIDATISSHSLEYGLLSSFTSFLTVDTAG